LIDGKEKHEGVVYYIEFNEKGESIDLFASVSVSKDEDDKV
jgi:hypothetical protein